MSMQVEEKTTELGKLVTVEEVCEMLSVTRQTLIRWEKEGKLHPIKIGERIKRYKLSEINSLLKQTQ